MHEGGLKVSLLVGPTSFSKNSPDSSLIYMEGLNEVPTMLENRGQQFVSVKEK